jgi:glycosyltransferase involved in cell wall biosynthesis
MPTLSLCLIVRNVGRYVEHVLRSAVPFAHEVIIVDTGSDDDTKDVIRREVPAGKLKLLDFTPQTHPDSFILDAAETWEGAVPGPFTNKQMFANFGGARQLGWKQATGDYIMWLDADDVLERGENLAGILVEMQAEGVDFALVNYDYSTDGNGLVNLALRRERIVRRTFGSYWEQPVHEVLVPMGVGRPYDRERLSVLHKRHVYGDTHGILHRNLKILYRWYLQNKTNKQRDPRMLFYLGMETRFMWPDRAVEFFNEYCARSGWDEERGVAHVHCGQLHEKAGRLTEAFAEYAQGHIEFPWSPDPLLGCARVAYFKQDWGKVIEYTERAFKLRDDKSPERVASIMWNPMDYNYWPYIQYTAALVNTGQFQRAIDAAKEALAVADNSFIRGNMESAQNNLKILAERAEGKDGDGIPLGKIPLNLRRDVPYDAPPTEVPNDVLVAFALQTLWRRALDEQPARALALLDNLPLALTTHGKIRGARDYTLGKLGAAPAATPAPAPSAPAPQAAPPSPAPAPAASAPAPIPEGWAAGPRVTVAAGKLEIVCWTGPGWEEWNPRDAIARGLGGSELAAVYLMRELAKRGHRVHVNGNPGPAAGMHDGVEYMRWDDREANHRHLKPDVLIVSRAPQAFLNGYDAKANFLWVHDIHCGEPVGDNMVGIMRADRIFCLSEWHKGFFLSQYPFLHPDTIIVTRNGIDTGRFAKEPVKAGKRLIWTSTPHRGLDRLLDLLPEIQKEVPGTELDVFYGFTTWERIANAQNDHQSLSAILRLKQRLSSTPGVRFHDRKGQQELADAFSAASVWAYPTWFTETSCITAMEAQAGGCVPVVTRLAALSETVKHGILLDPPSNTPEYGRAFVSNVVHMLRDEPARKALADAGRAHALANLDWSRVAVEWETIFHKTIAAKAGSPLPAYGNI